MRATIISSLKIFIVVQQQTKDCQQTENCICISLDAGTVAVSTSSSCINGSCAAILRRFSLFLISFLSRGDSNGEFRGPSNRKLKRDVTNKARRVISGRTRVDFIILAFPHGKLLLSGNSSLRVDGSFGIGHGLSRYLITVIKSACAR